MTQLDDLRFTVEELEHLYRGAHLLATQAQEDAARQRNPATREIFERAATVYLGLAQKVERLVQIALAGPK